MANRIPVKAIFTGSDVTALGEFASGDTIDVSYIADGTITAAKLAADTATQAELDTVSTVASAALPKAGGTMTGSITAAANALFGDTSGTNNNRAKFGNSNDLQIFHDGLHSYIEDSGTGDLIIAGANVRLTNAGNTENHLHCADNGAVSVYHNGVTKLATSANGVSVTGAAVGTMTTDNDGSFALSASNHFKCTPSGNFTLTFTSIVSQSGNILLVNSGGHTVSAHANTKVDAKFLSTISTAGTYLLAYFSDGTNVYMTNSAIYT